MEFTENSALIKARLRTLREFKGLRQQEVAELLHTTQQAYSTLERSKNNPSLDTLIRFCEVVGVDITFLLAFDIPVTEGNIKKYGQGFGNLVIAHERMLIEKEKIKKKPR